MPRDLPIGNGNMLIAFDQSYLLRELYFPHVGEENHVNNEPFRFGVFVDGQLSWLSDGWKIEKEYLDDSLVTAVRIENLRQELQIECHDCVDFHENIYIKKLRVKNLSDRKRSFRLFFSQDFHISGSDLGNTAEFRPGYKALLHYKDKRYFFVGVYANGKYGIEEFATGNKVPGRFEGTWKDAEDGVLSGNPIAQGSVDSTLGIPLEIPSQGVEECYYFICCGTNWEEVKVLYEVIQKKYPEEFLHRTQNYWSLWINKEPINPNLLSEKIVHLYKKSLLIVRSHINNCGSIIAANDSDVEFFNRDTYSYMWPRDGALVANALDLAGHWVTNDFFSFCAKIIEKDGYFLHKYTPSGSLASSWHPWIDANKEQLPIQEDETALVIWALWQHYNKFKDIEFIKPLYKTLVKRAADFMVAYRDPKTGLPLPSYDLWEERRGVSTFTASTVYGGLMAACNFTDAFGEKELSDQYREAAMQVKEGIQKHLYLKEEKRFARMLLVKEDDSFEVDTTLDASLYGLFAFGVYDPEDEKIESTMEQVKEKLWNTQIGGLARYENDSFYRSNEESSPNPWFVTTLWLAEYYIARSTDKKGLKEALTILEWVAEHALPSGVLSEQLDGMTGKQVSVSPLTWSHGTFIATVQKYLDKLLEVDKCPFCGETRRSKRALLE